MSEDVYRSIGAKIGKAWEQDNGTVDWLGLEATLREILRVSETYMGAIDKLVTIDEAIAAFTKRGSSLNI